MNVALVTGAARGIGRGIAMGLAKNNFDVALVYVSADDAAEKAVELCQTSGVKAVAIKADISKRDDRARIVEHMKTEFGRLDLLVNNAGVAPKVRLDLLESTEESYDWVMDVNLKGPYFRWQSG